MSSSVELPKEQRRLDAFLVDNQELESLTARLARFNLFRVLNIEKAEILHSNVLAWLLTSGETRGLGNTFLRGFLSSAGGRRTMVEQNPAWFISWLT